MVEKMSLIERVKAIIASGLALAATPDANTWKTPRPLSPLTSDALTTSVLMPSPSLPQPEPEPQPQPPTAAPGTRELVVLASGFAIAAAAAVGIWVFLGADSGQSSKQPKADVVPAQSPALASRQLADCGMAPAAAAASEQDGRFPLQADVAGLIAADIAFFIVIGNESATAGRLRDAEAAFLMSCRVADKLKGAGSVEVADAKYQLGALYAGLARSDATVAGPQRTEWLGRAGRLFADSSQTYLASYGQAHEKSQLAARGLAALPQVVAPTPTPAAVSEPAPASVQAQPAVPPAPESPLATRNEAPVQPTSPAPPAAGTAQSAGPLPPSAGEGKDRARQRPPVIKECVPAVAALGLCDPGI